MYVDRCMLITLFPLMLGGVGFDINCGVRLLRTNLDEKDVQPVKEQLAQVCVLQNPWYAVD